MLLQKIAQLINLENMENFSEVYTVLNQELLGAKDVEVSYRVLSHWDETKLIHFKRENETSNRKFNMFDFLWIKIINELRSFGMGLKTIKVVAEDLFMELKISKLFEMNAKNMHLFKDIEFSGKNEFIEFLKSGAYKDIESLDSNKSFSPMAFIITQTVVQKKAISIIIFNDGEWLPLISPIISDYPEDILMKIENNSYIHINITKLIYQHIFKENFAEYAIAIEAYSDFELELIAFLKESSKNKIEILDKSNLRIDFLGTNLDEGLPYLIRLIRANNFKQICFYKGTKLFKKQLSSKTNKMINSNLITKTKLKT